MLSKYMTKCRRLYLAFENRIRCLGSSVVSREETCLDSHFTAEQFIKVGLMRLRGIKRRILQQK